MIKDTNISNSSYSNKYHRNIFLWVGAFLVGFFLIMSATFTAFLMIPIYIIGLYSAFKYTTSSSFTPQNKNKMYLLNAGVAFISIVLTSVFISMVNPVVRSDDNKVFTDYDRISSYQKSDDSQAINRVGASRSQSVN